MARPSRYQSDYARQARMLCRLGGSYADLAESFSISQATLYRWLERHADFAAAVAIGSAQAASPFKPSLYKRATGYEYMAERLYAPRKDGTPVVARYRRRVHADARAALRWLRVRRPEEWCINLRRRARLAETVDKLVQALSLMDKSSIESLIAGMPRSATDASIDSHNPSTFDTQKPCPDTSRLPEAPRPHDGPASWSSYHHFAQNDATGKIHSDVGSQKSSATMSFTCRRAGLGSASSRSYGGEPGRHAVTGPGKDIARPSPPFPNPTPLAKARATLRIRTTRSVLARNLPPPRRARPDREGTRPR